MSAKLQEALMRERPSLPHPLERASDADCPYADIPLTCAECGVILTAREVDPDWSYDGEDEGGSSWSGSNGRCVDCAEVEDE